MWRPYTVATYPFDVGELIDIVINIKRGTTWDTVGNQYAQTWNKSNENASEPREMASVEFTGNAPLPADRAPPARPDGKTMPSCAAMAQQPHEINRIIICSDAI